MLVQEQLPDPMLPGNYQRKSSSCLLQVQDLVSRLPFAAASRAFKALFYSDSHAPYVVGKWRAAGDYQESTAVRCVRHTKPPSPSACS